MRSAFFNRYFSIMVILTLSIIGCSGMPLKKDSTEEVLKSRSAAFLQAMVDKNWAVAYEFFDSSFKKQVSRDLFAAYPRKSELKGFSVLGVSLSETGKGAEVNVTVDLSVDKGFTFKGIKKVQNWIIQKGKWVLVEPAPAQMTPTKE